jgi:hypothetical protein
MNKLLILPFLLVSMTGCVTATVSDTNPGICDTFDLGTPPSFPVSVGPGIPLPDQYFTTQMDFSSSISKLSDVANNLTVNVSNLNLSNNGDLTWVDTIDVSISATGMPSIPFASYENMTGTDPGPEVSMKVLIDSGTLLSYLEHPITLQFNVNGTIPTKQVDFENTMCIGLNGKFSKSL